MSQELECQKCSHKWNYTGNSDYYATCPSCKTSVKIPSTEADGVSEC